VRLTSSDEDRVAITMARCRSVLFDIGYGTNSLTRRKGSATGHGHWAGPLNHYGTIDWGWLVVHEGMHVKAF